MIKSVRYCPRSSLTLSGDGSLFEQKLSPLFTTGYSLLGGSVIYSRPEGIADEKSMGLCIDINQAIADEILSERNSYIQIEDYAELQDSSSRARRLMIDYYNNINRCAALIFCNLSIAFRTAVKLGTPLIKRSFPILIAHDYAQAVEWAIEICEREEMELDRVEPPLAYRPGSHSLLSLKYDFLPGDSGRTAGSVALLNDRILHFTLAPVLNEREVTSLEEKSQILMGRIGRAMGDADYILADCGDLKEIHSPVRKFVIHRIREILNQERKPVFILYNTGSVIAAFVKLVLPLVAITVKMAATRDEALRKALEEISMTPRHEPRKPKKSETAMNKLLALTASIKWDQPGLQLPDSIKNEPEMQSIREVLILIKEEVDYLFQEKSRTEQKLQEMVISLSEAQRKLIQNEKYTALGQLSAGMAHNINNSLTIIQGYVDLMQQDDNLRKSQLGYLEDITDTVQYSSMILGKLLSYSKKGKVKPEDRDLNRYLSEIRPELASLLPEGISLDCQISEESLPVVFDRERLDTVMENIICNASEAMPLGGQISIGTEKKAEKGKLSCSVCHSRIKGEWAVLTVVDGGSGIGEREISRIFEPFYSTRSFGAGLGLSQTSGIISQHGGHIVVESSSGRGTKMKIYLPLRDPSDQEKRKQESSTGDGGREKIFF